MLLRPIVAVVLVVLAGPGSVFAEIDRDLFRSPDGRVELIVPQGWFLSEQSAYPGLLVTAVNRETPGRMALGAQPIAPGVSPMAACEASAKTLASLGFRPGKPQAHASGACILDVIGPKGKMLLRQAYRTHLGELYVLTLAAPRELMPSYLAGFDDTLASMVFFDPRPEAPLPAEPAEEPASDHKEGETEAPDSVSGGQPPTPDDD